MDLVSTLEGFQGSLGAAQDYADAWFQVRDYWMPRFAEARDRLTPFFGEHDRSGGEAFIGHMRTLAASSPPIGFNDDDFEIATATADQLFAVSSALIAAAPKPTTAAAPFADRNSKLWIFAAAIAGGLYTRKLPIGSRMRVAIGGAVAGLFGVGVANTTFEGPAAYGALVGATEGRPGRRGRAMLINALAGISGRQAGLRALAHTSTDVQNHPRLIAGAAAAITGAALALAAQQILPEELKP